MTGAEFRARVTGHLSTALALVPDVVPDDVFDDRVDPLMRELQDLDELLFGLGREQRQMEDQEESRERRVAAKAKQPSVEDAVIRLDTWVGKLVEAIGLDDRSQRYVTSIDVDMVIWSLVRLLDLVPSAAIDDGRFVPAEFPSHKHPIVAAIIALLRERRAQAGAA